MQLAAILLIISQASSVAGQNPATRNRSDPPSNSSEAINAESDKIAVDGAESNSAAATQFDFLLALVFDETRIEDAREGHATLTWNDLAEASTYRVSEADGSVLYNGALPQAFVSGLEDGKHQFTVHGLDAAGKTIATSQAPAVVEVQHWPMAQAMALFAVGAVVFVALVAVLVYGAITCRDVDDRVTHGRGASQL